MKQERCGALTAAFALREAAKRIAAAGSPTPRLDAELILSHVLGVSRERLAAHSDYIIEENAAKAFREAVSKREGGLPVAYITGVKAFWLHEFEVTRDVLIPKPDTELLVEKAEAALRELASQKERGGGSPATLLDMCTGSGCVAISIKFDFPQALVAGADISKEALSVAERNARKILITQGEGAGIAWLACDLRAGLPPPPFAGQEKKAAWDIIAANPPYVPAGEALSLLADGRGEPLLALDGGEGGMSLMRPLIFNAAKALNAGGFLLVEAGDYNADAAASCFKDAGFADVAVARDLAGQKRVVQGRIFSSK